MEADKEHWDIVIKPRGSNFSLNIKEVWKYRDLVRMYVHRDIVTAYKQTILGPIWYVIQPLFTAFMYMFVFGGIAKISTDGLPQILFYLSNILCWSYFSECLGRASGTFAANAGVFSKVYFPRLVVPISGVISNLLKFAIQLGLFLIVYIYFYAKGANIQPNIHILLFPLLVFMSAGLGFGFGIIISSMTTKYRDLAILFGFVTQLWMYATPIIYPLSAIPAKASAFKWIIELNPMTPIVETMRYAFLGQGVFSWYSIGYSLIVTIVIMIIGTWTFNKMERSFIDIV
ncbi:ABC transporter permease [Dysgonomonas sp. BGC7]|uniref:ABC transporter permease n=1 Tax=Dysgonomonas sp. BGC7 TaxID=1658008 RepID=UPI00067FE9F4|nr:ABC transporter permease [Dysgonomonas sp. BGC7]MBD8390048.1 ABC transporter permease [Dysgonomonas sp. BGC7]